MDKSHHEWKKFKTIKQSDMFAFVSSPKMPQQQNTLFAGVKSWCHPFKSPNKFLKNKSLNYIMMPESDFLDEKLIIESNSKPEYDFFYMTLNAKAGKTYKGLDTFIESLPILCGKLKLTGFVVVYFPSISTSKSIDVLNKNQKKILNKYSQNLNYIWGLQSQRKLAGIMSMCKFGFFPNEVDCSPRLIPECLLRNRPIIVNSKIWGGWHYVNDNTGRFFDTDNLLSLESGVDFIKSHCRFDTKSWFMSNYGFKKSSSRLVEFLSNSHEQVKDFKHVYFKSYSDVIKDLI